jgi:hypothetical protein
LFEYWAVTHKIKFKEKNKETQTEREKMAKRQSGTLQKCSTSDGVRNYNGTRSKNTTDIINWQQTERWAVQSAPELGDGWSDKPEIKVEKTFLFNSES